MRISRRQYQSTQPYIRVGFSSPAQASIFLVCTGNSVGVGYRPCVIPRPDYWNYKGTDSIILLAMVGPEYEFLFVDVGMNGRNSNGGNWSQSCLKNGLEKNTLNLPDPTPLLGWNYPLPYMCTGDDAFPLENKKNCIHDETLSSKNPEFREVIFIQWNMYLEQI